MRFAADDYTAWLSCCREATLFRESDLVGEQQRLRSTIYQECYQPFEVYDSLQYGIVCNGQPLGALSLFRCREDGPFSDHELFLLRSVGTHLNQQMAALLAGTPPAGGSPDHSLAAVAARHGLTLRERQLLEELTRFRNNQEIAEALSVRASTLQKHFQNMFRKFGVTSRWELMRLLLEEGALPWVPLSPRANKKDLPAGRSFCLCFSVCTKAGEELLGLRLLGFSKICWGVPSSQMTPSRIKTTWLDTSGQRPSHG